MQAVQQVPGRVNRHDGKERRSDRNQEQLADGPGGYLRGEPGPFDVAEQRGQDHDPADHGGNSPDRSVLPELPAHQPDISVHCASPDSFATNRSETLGVCTSPKPASLSKSGRSKYSTTLPSMRRSKNGFSARAASRRSTGTASAA